MKETLLQYKFGIIGLVFATLGIFTAIFQENIREALDPNADKSITEKAVDKTKDYLNKKFLDEPAEVSPGKPATDVVTATYFLLGFLAIVFGIISFIVNENNRLAASAFSAGLIAVAWQYVMYAVFIALIVMFLMSYLV